MVTEAAVWAIFLLPLGSFVLIALVIRPFLNRWPLLAAVSTIGSLAAATVLAALTLRSVILGNTAVFNTWEWLSFGGAAIEMGLLVDPLTAVMLVVVTSISLLIQIYSVGYMQGDPGFARYFAYMSLFTASMLGLTLSSNIIQLYAFWELVGVSSYLLIGFWHERPSAAAAAKKAFIITRIGDAGFLIAILYLFFKADDFAAAGLNAFHIPDIWQAAQPLAAGGAILAGASLTWMALGIFAGAVGKSGQFPLHAWLPDAMEGPTPVSALIHAATMVAAGVFLVARFFPVFQQSGHRHGRGDPDRRLHRPHGRHYGPGDERHKAGDGLFHGQPAWLYDGRAGIGGIRPGHLPPSHARGIQGPAVPGRGKRESCQRHVRYAVHGGVVALYARHLPAGGYSRPQPHRHHPLGRVLEQG